MTAISQCPSQEGPAVPVAKGIALRIEDPTAREDWDGLVATHPDATFFHTSAWAQTLADAYGFRCRYVTAAANGRLCGLLPVMEADSWLCGTRGVSLPFTDELSPLVAPHIDATHLFARAVQDGEERRWKYLELRGGHDVLENLPESVSFFSHVLPLCSRLDDIFDNCESSVRRAIRKSERCGVTVQFGTDLDSVRAYYRLHCQTRTRLGAPPQPFGFFRSIWNHVLQKGHGFIALALHNHQPIAGAVFFQFGRKAIYKFSASDDRHQELRGANLVIWHTLRKLVAAGVSELNFGRTSLHNEGLRRFKKGWGSEERLIHYARYSFARQGFVHLDDLAAGSYRRAFSLLPVPLSRWVGRAVYRHLS